MAPDRVQEPPEGGARASSENPRAGAPWLERQRRWLEQAGLGLDVEAAWGGLDLLAALDRRLEVELAEGSGLDPRKVAAAGAALGAALSAELTLEWVDGSLEESAEPALRYASSEVLLYPVRMVRAHLEGARRDRTPARLERLVDSTAAYLDHLVRYFPSRLGLERRSRGARRRG